MALAEAIKHTIFLCQLLNDKKGNDMDESEHSVTIYMDNQSAPIKNPEVKTYRQKLLFYQKKYELSNYCIFLHEKTQQTYSPNRFLKEN